MPKQYEKVIGFITSETGYSEDKILIKTRLYHDVGLDGDEAEEFIEAFAEAFNVDMKGFEFYRYFNKEGLDSLALLGSLFKTKRDQKPLDEITVEMLEQAALKKRWNA